MPSLLPQRKTFAAVQVALAALAISLPMAAGADNATVNITSGGPDSGDTYTTSDLLVGGANHTVAPGINGFSGSYDSNGNTVTIDGWNDGGSTSSSSVAGGGGIGGGTVIVHDNRVIVEGATVITGKVVGGANATNGETHDNHAILNGGSVGHDLIGGIGQGSGSIHDNDVEVNGGAVSGDVGGGWADSSSSAIVQKNTATITGGTVSGAVHGGVSQDGDAYRNTVIVTGGTLQSIVGGVAHNANATDNTVEIVGGTFGGAVYGGQAAGNANANILNIRGGAFAQRVSGGSSSSASGTASGNILNLSGGTFNADVSGGRITTSGSGNANNNIINLSGSANLDAASLYGGIGVGGGDYIAGNTLNLKGWTGKAVTIGNFASYNFYLPGTLTNGGTVLEVVTANIDNSRINVGIDGAHTALNAGDTVTLIKASTSLSASGINTATDSATLSDGVIDIKGTLAATATQLDFSVTSLGANASTKALSEGYAGGLAFVAQAGDLAARQGVTALQQLQGRDAPGGLRGFGALEWGSSRHDTGSHVDVKGYHLLAGLGAGGSGSAGNFTLGAFFEGGDGDYDTRNSFANSTVKGDGDARYYGAGILGRFDFAGNFYLDGSLRAGRVENDFSAVLNGRRSKYESESLYTSLHAGLGYLWQLSGKNTLDVNAQYLWTRQDGDSATLSTGHRIRFDAADSERLRIGARFSTAMNERANFYAGAAWEREFDGKIDATINGYRIDAPELKGNTGIAEIGFTLKPASNSPLSLEAGLQAYGGQRDGASGAVKVNYRF
ncbi:MAG: autotransporter domain-containing protein [Zoogloeaceae bacterium]|jgi:outer membrane autotransporter protein|nr:autotransporter domain-containing protein [Zoogloeaceae bacterium]